MKTLIHCNLETGDVRFLHNDTVAEIVGGEMSTTRASQIVFNRGAQQWEVQSADFSQLLYQGTGYDDCHAWENDHFNRDPSDGDSRNPPPH